MQSRWDESFGALVAHFIFRFFDTDSPSEESVPRNRLIQSLALLLVATPLLMVFMLRGEQSIHMQLGTFDAAWWWTGIHFTLVCFEMSVMGLVMTLKWDSLFPDRRDYLILTPLPVSTKRMFLAKVIAVGIILLLFATAANAVLIMLVGFMQPRALVGHIVAVLGASIFAVLFSLALQGILISLLPANAYRRLSPPLQTVAIALLITLLLVLPLVAVSLRPLVAASSPLIDYFPPVWFLGIYELLVPSSTPIPQLKMWALRAVILTASTALLAVFCYAAGYRRHCRRVLESFDTTDLRPRWGEQIKQRILHSVLGVSPFQRAAFDFIDKISCRSSIHRISAASYSGLGIALALSSLFVIDRREAFPIRLSGTGVLEAPAVLSFLLVAGWHFTFGVPCELAANWIFQMTSRTGAADFRKAIRKWLFVCRVLPLYALVGCFEFAWFEPAIAFRHLVFDLITTSFLVEAFFFGFRKVPYTCTYLQRKAQVAFHAIAYLFVYTTYTTLMGALKRWVSMDARHFLNFAAISMIVLGGILIYRALTGAERSNFIYDDREPAYTQLDLL